MFLVCGGGGLNLPILLSKKTTKWCGGRRGLKITDFETTLDFRISGLFEVVKVKGHLWLKFEVFNRLMPKTSLSWKSVWIYLRSQIEFWVLKFENLIQIWKSCILSENLFQNWTPQNGTMSLYSTLSHDLFEFIWKSNFNLTLFLSNLKIYCKHLKWCNGCVYYLGPFLLQLFLGYNNIYWSLGFQSLSKILRLGKNTWSLKIRLHVTQIQISNPIFKP